MAKRFIPIKFKEYYLDEQDFEQEKEIILMFRLGPKAIDLFQTVSGKSLDENELKDLGVKGIVQLLYSGCQAMHHDLTLDKMWELVDNFELDELGDIMSQIFPETEEQTDPNVK